MTYYINSDYLTKKSFETVKMSLNIESQTPVGQLLGLEDEEMSAAEQAIFERVLALSLQQSQKVIKKGQGLDLKYRKLITNMKMTKSSQKCTVCYSEFCQGELIKRFPCKHIFHRDCAKSWLKINKNCPNCRLDLQQHFQNLQKKEGKIVQKKVQCSKQNTIKLAIH